MEVKYGFQIDLDIYQNTEEGTILRESSDLVIAKMLRNRNVGSDGCVQWVLTTSPITSFINLYSFVIVVIKTLYLFFPLKREPITIVLDFTDSSSILQLSASFWDEKGKNTLFSIHVILFQQKKQPQNKTRDKPQCPQDHC